ncbi:MAG: alanyl aminopeptidase, partial [Bacteroidota bacterium]
MKYLSFAGILLLIFSACNSSKNTIVFPEMEERIMDTLVVTAPPMTEEEKMLDEIVEEDYELPKFNASSKRTFDLLHTKLEVRFDWAAEQVIGKATLTLKPYFYATDQLTLDAKNFKFNSVREKGKKEDLKYTYDEKQIVIDLGRELTRNDKIDIEIDYIET